ncbi:MarR family winged helix-turn-helix transcriptional regulator [Priestia megaterium]|uniref:MarR family winged helix-turn-helix transcriptional regulator n=1 Tax=Priestia megaterium TaxID=1404 RepID=UPI00211C3E78|nr:MarR family transcriptional regulator [Priestia megaterium]
MNRDSLQIIEHEIALMVRLTTTHSPKLGSMDRAEYLLLSELDQQHSPLGINALAEKLKLSLSTASRQVATLETKKFIRRFPSPENGRISLIEMTKAGEQILQRVQKKRKKAYAEVLENWSEEEIDMLQKNLSRLNEDFKKWRCENC